MVFLILTALAILVLVALLLLEAISVSYTSQITTVQTISQYGVLGTDPTVTFTGLNTSGTYTASTTPAVTKRSSFQKALSGGTGTIDLTSLTGLTADEVVTFTTLKLVFYKFRNPSTNANNITITFGASLPHLIFGAAGTVVLPPGAEVMGFPAATGLTIDSTHKNIDISGTTTQALDVELVAG